MANSGFKAMFATSSKYEAIKYHEILKSMEIYELLM